MILRQFFKMKGELLEAVYREQDPNTRVTLVAEWFATWLKELHVEHTFDRQMLHHYAKDASGLIGHAHKRMFYEAGEAIGKSGYGVMQTDFFDEDERPHPLTRRDRYTVYVLGAK